MLIVCQPNRTNRAEIYREYNLIIIHYNAKLTTSDVDAIMMALWIEIGVAYLHCVVILA
jgi:hypothetical protein